MAALASSLRRPAVIVALLGLVLSLLLELVHYRAYVVPSASSFCSAGAKLDCASVALSRYSVVLGVPMPLWGVAGFLALLVAAWRRSRWLLPLAALATLASLALLVIELTIIGSVCLLCEAVHVACAVLLVLGWRERKTGGSLTSREDALLIFAPALGLLAALMLFQRPYWGVFNWKGDVPFPQGTTAEGYPWIGAEQPKVTVHEFTDYSCPHCKVASNRLLRVLAEHADELRIVRRQNSRMPCPVGVTVACEMPRIAYCAQEQGKAWAADRWLFEHGTGRSSVDLNEAARDIGLDAPKLRACVIRDDIYRRAEADAKLVRKKQLPGTPYYLVNDKKMDPEQLDRHLAAVWSGAASAP